MPLLPVPRNPKPARSFAPKMHNFDEKAKKQVKFPDKLVIVTANKNTEAVNGQAFQWQAQQSNPMGLMTFARGSCPIPP
jgi:flavin reductase (DIM6/NTAB) family NADH-FMN oxidoreductase RutF